MFKGNRDQMVKDEDSQILPDGVEVRRRWAEYFVQVLNVEKMDEYRMAKMVSMAEVSGGRVRGRPRLGWMDGVKVALGNRGMMVDAAREISERVESPGTYM